MAIDLHTIELVGNSQVAMGDRILIGVQAGLANAAGGSAGASVTVAVNFAAGSLPSNYAVLVTPAQDATAFVTAKTSNGFNVTLVPRLASATLAASTFDVAVLG
jgi:hypothetical protein